MPADPLLLERDDELKRLDAMLEKASAGSGAVVRVNGPAGIGKSELLAAVRGRASRQGLRTLSASGHELETELAFAAVRQTKPDVAVPDIGCPCSMDCPPPGNCMRCCRPAGSSS